MNQKFVLTSFLITVLHLGSFSQDVISKKNMLQPLIIDEGISNVTVADNIDVVLIQSSPENVAVKVMDEVLGKLKVHIYENDIQFTTAKNLSKSERVTVYVFVHDLQNLTLSGTAFAMSRGILNSKHLRVNIDDSARVSIRSNGEVQINSKGKFQLSKDNEEYSSLFACE